VDPVSGPLPADGPARSWLFVPATRPERFAKAAASGAHRIIVDLEDAVAPEAKEEARRRLSAELLPAGVPVYLRVNPAGTAWHEADLQAARGLPVAGVVLPKADSGEQVARVAAALQGPRTVVPIVETAAGVWHVLEIAQAPRVERVAFGALDFRLDAAVAGDDVELAYARSRIVIASRVAGVAAPLDAVTPSLDDERQLANDLDRARRFGFGGKLCIHPRQVAATHRAFAPTAEELAWARGLLEALAGRAEQDRGTFSYRGEMVDRPVIDRARRLLGLSS
jgi:citrate lyase subunit beta / citryl-CoA lyase